MPGKILIIEDDTELVEELCEILKDEGYDVSCAHESTEGIARLQKEKYDAILLDYKMPGNMDGICVLNKIKEKGIKTAVILISGKPEIEKKLEEAGVKPLIAAVMPKPFDIEKLLLEIKKHTP